MSVKEELKKIQRKILNAGDVDVALLRIKKIFDKYYLDGNEAQENHEFLKKAWANNKGNYGAHDSLAKREKLSGLLNVYIEEIPADIDLTKLTTNASNGHYSYIDNTIISAISEAPNPSGFKLDRLIKICNEINSSYKNENYFAVAILIRSILDIVPPIFGKSKFSEVVSNVSMSQSHKKQLETLQTSLRNYADGCVHIQINKAHAFPNKSNLNFSSELSVLLELINEELK